MKDRGHAGRRGRDLVVAWRRWQLGLALSGVVLGVALASGDLKSGAGDEGRLRAQVARQDHGAPVWSLAFAGDGVGIGRLASSTMTGELRLKDWPDGRVLRLEDGTRGIPLSVAFSPDGRTLAVAGNGSAVRLWDAETGGELGPLDDEAGAIRAVAFSPDGAALAVGTGAAEGRPSRVALRTWPGRRPLASLEGGRGSINALAFSPDGSVLVITDSAGELTIRDVATGRERARRRAHEEGVMAMAVSPDGRRLATAGYLDGTVRLWDAADGEPRGSLPDVATRVTALGFSPDGTMLATARADGVASLWEVASGREAGSVRVPWGSLQAVAFSGDGRVLATGGIDGSVRLWDAGEILAGDPRRPRRPCRVGHGPPSPADDGAAGTR